MQTIDTYWMDSILVETARRCLKALDDGTTAPVGSDSSAVETDRYAEVERPSVGMQDFVMMRARTYTKYHVTAVLGHQIILATLCTPSNVADTTVLPEMPGLMGRHRPGMRGRLPRADRRYDSDRNCARACEAGIVHNTRQRKN